MAEQRTGSGLGGTRIVRHKLGQIDIYEISADELLILERGTWADYLFDIAIALFSISVTLFITLKTVTFGDFTIRGYFKYALVITIILCVSSFVGWFFRRKSKSDLINEIKNREAE